MPADPLEDLTRVAPAQGGTFALSYLAPPWGLHFATGAPLSVHLVIRGGAHLRPGARSGDAGGADTGPGQAGGLLALGTGDLVLAQGPHTISDDPGTAAGAVIYGPGRSAEPGQPPSGAGDRWRMPTPRSYGEGEQAPTVLAHASYRAGSVLSQRLLATLPPALLVSSASVPAGLRELLTGEVTRTGLHQQPVLDRLLDLVVAIALRSWLEQPGGDAPAWVAALRDVHVGPALSAVHERPAHPWTTQALAQVAHTSRAHLVRRFSAVLGQPPITYLTRYRIDLAAELVSTTGRPLAAIAREVGYGDAFALSAAYRRVTGHSPRADRSRADGKAEAL